MRRIGRTGVAVGMAGCLLLAGCKTGEQGAVIGALIGGGAAALACKNVKNDAMRMLCIGGGAALAGAIGSKIAEALEEQDRQRLLAAQEQALNTSQPVSFSNPETGVTGRVTVLSEAPPQTVTKPVKVLKERVTTVPPLDLVNAPYRATANTNLRGGPGTDYAIVGKLAKGETVQVLGRVKGKDWYLLGSGDVGTGYAFHNLLSPVGSGAPAPALAPPPGAVSEVAAATEQLPCRRVRQEVTVHDRNLSEDVTMCQQGDGSWRIA